MYISRGYCTGFWVCWYLLWPSCYHQSGVTLMAVGWTGPLPDPYRSVPPTYLLSFSFLPLGVVQLCSQISLCSRCLQLQLLQVSIQFGGVPQKTTMRRQRTGCCLKAMTKTQISPVWSMLTRQNWTDAHRCLSNPHKGAQTMTLLFCLFDVFFFAVALRSSVGLNSARLAGHLFSLLCIWGF